MFDLLVFTQHPNAYAPKRFEKTAKLQGFTLQVIGYDQVDIGNLPDAKAVILREPDYKKDIYNLRDEVLDYYLSKNAKVLNAKSYLKWSVLDKITQHKEFKKAKIPYIKTLKLQNSKTQNLMYPFIAKNKLGSHGDSVYKITCKEDLDKVLEKHKLEDLLIQEFQNSGFDLRVIVIDFKVVGIMKRTPKSGEFLSNYSQGGKIERYKVNRDKDIKLIEQISIKTAKHFKLDFVGVDLMKGNDNRWKVLEVNRACQFKGFEKATGENIAYRLIDYLKN